MTSVINQYMELYVPCFCNLLTIRQHRPDYSLWWQNQIAIDLIKTKIYSLFVNNG